MQLVVRRLIWVRSLYGTPDINRLNLYRGVIYRSYPSGIDLNRMLAGESPENREDEMISIRLFSLGRRTEIGV